MSVFRRMRGVFHEDWCSACTAQMDVIRRRLYAMPSMSVGHYVSHTDGAYYNARSLVRVERKAEIPAGMYACGVVAYRCPQCGHRAVRLTTFLPVRGEEKREESLYFENGELDGLLWNVDDP